MQKYKYITLMFVVLFLVGCAKDDFIANGDLRAEKAVYGFGVGGGTTRTFINDDGVTISWSNDDKVALWAKPATGGDYVLSNRTFNTWFVTADNSQAFFTAELDNAMPTNTYQYYVTYPTPSSVNGTTCTYTLPAMQDGMMGGGADIMVGEGEGPALAKLYDPEASTPDYVIKDGVKLQMKHLIHALRFYVPAGKWGLGDGETIERIVFTMPDNVAGTVTTDVSAESPALSSPANATNTISLNLNEPIGASTANAEGVINYDYACVSILPGTYNGDMTVKVYSQTKATQVTIPINGREMKAGHITPVGLNCTDVVNQYVLRIKWGGNNLGENVNKITFHDENGNEVSALTITDVANKFKKEGDYYDINLTFGNQSDINAIKALAGKNITVKYDSEHAIVSTSFTFPSGIENGFFHEETLTVPYLFFENFDQIGTFDNDCANAGVGSDSSNTGNKDSAAFSWQNGISKGWKGARSGGEEGIAVRMSCRFEAGGLGKVYAEASYPGRIDSSPIVGLKKATKVRVSFDYLGGQDAWMMESNLEDGGTYGNPVLAYGYTTSSSDFDGGDNIPNPLKTGIAAETDGDWDKPFHTIEYDIDNFNNGYCLSWRVTVNRVGLTSKGWFTLYGANGNHYIFLDNIKVQIAK